MIVSDRHRYLFIEQPHTACTAIHDELCALYDGRPILFKHATYADFLRVASPEQKGYFVFSGIRDPLDEAVSTYFKYKTDHKGRYSRRPAAVVGRRREAFELVAGDQADFVRYVRRFYRRPYDNDTLIAHRRIDHVMRFEHLQADFAEALRRIGLEQVRPLPVVNKTGERGHHLDYYPEEVRDHARRVFGPFMLKWGYPIPAAWADKTVPASSRLAFRVLGVGRYVYRRYLRRQTHPLARGLAAAVDRVRPLGYRLLRW